MVTNTKVNGKMMPSMAKGKKHIQKEQGTKVITSVGLNQVKVSINGQIIQPTLGNGKTT